VLGEVKVRRGDVANGAETTIVEQKSSPCKFEDLPDVVWVATRGVKSRGHLRLSDGTDKEIAARPINSDLTPAVEPLNYSSKLTSSCAQVADKAESEGINYLMEGSLDDVRRSDPLDIAAHKESQKRNMWRSLRRSYFIACKKLAVVMIGAKAGWTRGAGKVEEKRRPRSCGLKGTEALHSIVCRLTLYVHKLELDLVVGLASINLCRCRPARAKHVPSLCERCVVLGQ
jgi:hypothetical protein